MDGSHFARSLQVHIFHSASNQTSPVEDPHTVLMNCYDLDSKVISSQALKRPCLAAPLTVMSSDFDPDGSTYPTSSSFDKSSSTSSEKDVWTGNEGETSDEDEEAPADPHQRGQAALVTAACPRKYPRSVDSRRRAKKMIPSDYPKGEFLTKFRRTFNRVATEKLDKPTCHDESHEIGSPWQT